MDDDEMLAALRTSLTGAKESLTDVRLDRSADAIRARARGRRLRRGLAVAGAGGTALGVGLALTAGGAGPSAPSVHVNLDAWSVNTLSGGLVYVDIRELQQPALLRQTLARAGVPAIVTFGEFCAGPSGGDTANLQQVLGKSPISGGKLTINPRGIPAGDELSIGIVAEPHQQGFNNSFALVKDGSRLTCGSPAAVAGKGVKQPAPPGDHPKTKTPIGQGTQTPSAK
jgi:hypothetical protein